MSGATARLVIVGATGRMGHALIHALPEFPQLRLHGAVTNEGHPQVGVDAGTHAGVAPLGVPITTDLAAALAGAQVAIDFSSAQATADTLADCSRAGVPLLIGTTGLDSAMESRFAQASARLPLLVAANTSLALNLLLELVHQAAALLPASYDIEISETHHRHKVDAPSGTALALGRAAAQGRNDEHVRPAAITGKVPGPREAGAIGYAVTRGGDVVGEHTVRFLGAGEQLQLAHVATDRTIFARGALAAALWLAGRPNGRYRMADVLGIKSNS